MNFSNEVSKLGFLFLAAGIIYGGYVTNIIPCQLQKFLKNNIYSHHVVGVLIFFMFIMMEGGWDINDEYKDLETDWFNSDPISSLIYAILLHSIFVLTSKMKYKMSIILYILLFVLYFINSFRLNNLLKEKIDNKKNQYIINIEKMIVISIIILCIFGISDYYIYQLGEYKDKFSNLKFLIGDVKCDHVNNA